ncbi:MAG: iron uptake porin [Cyanobacteria bacterium J06621_3]
MKNFVWKSLVLGSAALSLAVATSGRAMAAASDEGAESIAETTVADLQLAQPMQLAQVTNVNELSDVQPGDWAFTALQRLVEDYGCLEGYPDRTFRGNRALTRYEFAAGLNACLDVVLQLTDGSDLDEITRLQQEFADELAMLRGRVSNLEEEVAQLEANQFSTTTKLSGELYGHLIVPFGDTTEVADNVVSQDPQAALTGQDKIVGGDEADATFEYWALLHLDTSFTGEDNLRISLSGTDSEAGLANSENGLNYVTSGDADNVVLDEVSYSFPVGDRINATLSAQGLAPGDLVSSLIMPTADNAVAVLGYPEFYFLYPGGDFSAAANIDITDNLVLDLAYHTAESNVNENDKGLFNDYSYVAQLNLLTDGVFDAAVVYLDGDQSTDFVGGVGNEPLRSKVAPEYTLAGMASLDFGNMVISGHYAHSPADGVDGNLDSYAAGVTFPGLFGENNELGIYGGVSPAINRDPLLIEAYYSLGVNEFFTITPALIYTDNDSNVGDDDNFYGAVRAGFSF